MEIVAIAARHQIPRILAFTLLILATSWLALPVAAEVKVSEWKVPYPDSRPRDPYVDSAGRVWFCGQGDSYIAHLDPRSGSFTRYDLPDNAAPNNLIIDEQDQVWFAANTLPYIGRINASRHSIEHFEMPRGEARDPHTLAFDNVGNIWFTAQWSDQVGRLDMETSEVELFDMPAQGTRPYGIKVDARGRPWVALFGTNSLASIDPQSRRVWTFDLPDIKSRPRRLEIDRSGNIWYGDFSRGKLGRLDPDSGKIDEWPMPGGENAQPYGMALDARGNIWLAESGNPNRLVAFDPRRKAFIHVISIPNARGSIRHMYFDDATSSIWFGEDSNYIGRLQLQ